MEYEVDGSFWLEDPDETVRGRLKFTQDDGGDLRLEGILVGTSSDIMSEAEVIHGTALDGTELSLLNTFPLQLQMIASPKPAYPHRFFVNRVLIGTHDPEQQFEKIRVAIRGLLDFTAQSGLALTGGAGTPRPGQPVSISWTPNPDMPTAKVGEVEIELVTEHRFTADDYEFCLEHRAEVEIRGPGRTIDDWRTPIVAVEGFIAFFLGAPTRLDRLYAPLDDHQVEEIFQHREGGDRPRKGGPWVTLSEILDEFERAMTGWFAFADSDPEAFKILSEYLRFPGRLLAQDRLLYLARIIELYHRDDERFEQVLIPKDKHKARKKEVLKAAPEEHRQWLTDALAHSNEKTLRERITELVESFGEAIRPIAGGDPRAFAATATNNRNYFTHYSSYLKEGGRIVEGIELHWLVLRLLLLVRGCVLREMGFDNEAIARLLKRDRQYDTLAGQVRRR